MAGPDSAPKVGVIFRAIAALLLSPLVVVGAGAAAGIIAIVTILAVVVLVGLLLLTAAALIPLAALAIILVWIEAAFKWVATGRWDIHATQLKVINHE